MPIRRIPTATTVALALRLTSFDPYTPIQAVIEEEDVAQRHTSLRTFLDSDRGITSVGQDSDTVRAFSLSNELFRSLYSGFAGDRRCEREEASSMAGEVSQCIVISVLLLDGEAIRTIDLPDGDSYPA